MLMGTISLSLLLTPLGHKLVGTVRNRTCLHYAHRIAATQIALLANYTIRTYSNFQFGIAIPCYSFFSTSDAHTHKLVGVILSL